MVNITGQSCPDGRMKSCTDITGTAYCPRRRSWTGCLTARRFLLMYNTQLETFLVAADLGSFNKAAEALYISAPAVTKQINLLESSLGLQLFVRTHRGLILTEAGKSLYRDAKYIIQYCRESVERAKKAMQEKDRVIRIGTSPMTPAQPIVAVWNRV